MPSLLSPHGIVPPEIGGIGVAILEIRKRMNPD
jgi:hypothetical protein